MAFKYCTNENLNALAQVFIDNGMEDLAAYCLIPMYDAGDIDGSYGLFSTQLAKEKVHLPRALYDKIIAVAKEDDDTEMLLDYQWLDELGLVMDTPDET